MASFRYVDGVVPISSMHVISLGYELKFPESQGRNFSLTSALKEWAILRGGPPLRLTTGIADVLSDWDGFTDAVLTDHPMKTTSKYRYLWVWKKLRAVRSVKGEVPFNDRVLLFLLAHFLFLISSRRVSFRRCWHHHLPPS